MRIANYLSPAPLYQWDIVSFDGDEITASNGFTVRAHPPNESIRHDETIFVLGSWGSEFYKNPQTLAWIRRQARGGARLCSVELGCYLVARAGLLEGKSATTHWSYRPGFKEQFDGISVTEQLFTIDGQIMTCSGGLAGIDLMLRLVGDVHGKRLAGEIAGQLLYQQIRPGTAPQRSAMGRGIEAPMPMVQDLIRLIERNISEPLKVPDIARQLGVSQRQLERRLKADIGCTVVQFGLFFRLQHARTLLISTDLSVREIAAASGFNTLSHFAHTFGKCFGRRPSDYRQSWPEKAAGPIWPGALSEFLKALEYRGSAKPMQILRKPAHPPPALP